MSTRCLTCGTLYTAWSCPRCAEEKHHRESLSQTRKLAEEHAEQEARWREDFLETSRRLSEDADARVEAVAGEIQYSFREAQRETAEAFRAVIAHADVLQAQTKFDSGKQLLAAGMPDEALLTFGKAIELDPTFSAAYLFSAHLHLQRGDHASAKTHLSKGLRLLRVRPYDVDAEGWFEIICQFEQLMRADSALTALLTDALDSRLQSLNPHLPLLRALNGIRLQPLARKYSTRLAGFVTGPDAIALLDEMCAGQLHHEASDVALRFAGDSSDFTWKLFFWLYRRGIRQSPDDSNQLKRWLADIPLARRRVIAEAMRLPFFESAASEAKETARRIIIEHYDSTWGSMLVHAMERQLASARGIHESRLGVVDMILSEVRAERELWAKFWDNDPFRTVTSHAQEIRLAEAGKSGGFLKRFLGA